MQAYRWLVAIAALVALFVISLGAYVRLSDAGLGCPDWPGCYGHLIGVPEHPAEHAAALAAFPGKPVEVHKAWKEVGHRYVAGTLGLLIVAIALLAWRRRRELACSPWVPTLLLGVVIAQALLGMLTVTLLLKPLVVTAHLAGGMATFALLVLLWRSERTARGLSVAAPLRALGAVAMIAVIGQILLGGWVSSNYAALACPDFPTCGGLWPPPMDAEHAFQLRRELGQSADGALLSFRALVAIHWLHRVGALVVAIAAGVLCAALLLRRGWRAWGCALGTVLLAQLALGISNVLLSLPLPLAVAHNTGAAVLLATLVALNYRLTRASA